MELKIGVQHVGRELQLDSGQSPADVQQAVETAVRDGGILTLVDERGRRILVPVDKLAYVEIAEVESRRVGFGAM